MFLLKKPVTLGFLSKKLGLSFVGDSDYMISSVCPISEVVGGGLAFSTKVLRDNLEILGVVVTSVASESMNCIISDTPRLDFIRALAIIEKECGFLKNDTKPKIHPTARIAPSAVIENGVEIGERSLIEANVTIMSGTKIGSDCIVRCNSSIGSSGFGFERDLDGRPIKFVHLGGVSIGNNVEIGSCTCICQGTMSDTIIEDNVKIDNLVHVAHNCRIRNGAFLIACSEISGGVTVGENSWIAPNASITQKVSIGEGALVGLGAVVTKNVDEFVIVAGNPAKKIRDI